MFSVIGDGLERVLTFLHDLVEPLAGRASWGWAIVGVTVLIRLLMAPVAVRQFHSMRRMQALQPKLAALKRRYAPDKTLRARDPQRYAQRKRELQQRMTELYREHDVNPVAGCLPLLIQAPVFIAMLRVLRTSAALKNAPFYVFTAFVSASAQYHGLGTPIRDAGTGGWILLGLMVLTMALSQRQLAAIRAAATPDADGPTRQQRLLTYGMPALFGVVSVGFPVGVLVYWVTSNAWQFGQQHLLLRMAT